MILNSELTMILKQKEMKYLLELKIERGRVGNKFLKGYSSSNKLIYLNAISLHVTTFHTGIGGNQGLNQGWQIQVKSEMEGVRSGEKQRLWKVRCHLFQEILFHRLKHNCHTS